MSEEKESELERACKAILLEFYGESDARAYDLDRLALMEKAALWLLEKAKEKQVMLECGYVVFMYDLEKFVK